MSEIDPSAKIHPHAVIEEGAVIGADCEIGPFCLIGAEVKMGRGNQLFSHVAIAGETNIGEDNRFWPHAAIGYAPQDLKYNGEPTKLIIGDRNDFRESCAVHRGTVQDQGETRIGNDNLFMHLVHIAHDCVIGNNVVISAGSGLGGHVVVEDEAIIGGYSAIIQFARIGKGAMIGACSMVTADVIPYGLTVGERAHLGAINMIGLRRRGLSNAQTREIKQLYVSLFDGSAGLRKRAEELASQYQEHDYAREMIEFILSDSNRAFLAPFANPDD